MKIQFFAKARDLVGLNETIFNLNDLKHCLLTGEELLNLIVKEFPKYGNF